MQLGNELLKEYRNHLLAHGKLLATANCYESDARSFIQYLGHIKSKPVLDDLDDLASFQTYLELDEKESVNSVRRKIIGVKSFLRFSIPRLTDMPSGFESYPIPSRREDLPDCLTQEDIEDLLKAASRQQPQLKGLRDQAILCLLAFEGLKVNEIIQLRNSDIMLQASGGSCLIRGPRDRVIDLCSDTSKAISDYRDILKLETSVKNSLFVGIRGRQSSLQSGSITRHGIKFILYELGSLCQIKYLNSELLRHFAMDFQLQVRGLSTEEAMGHFGLRQPGNIARHARRLDLATEINTEINTETNKELESKKQTLTESTLTSSTEATVVSHLHSEGPNHTENKLER